MGSEMCIRDRYVIDAVAQQGAGPNRDLTKDSIFHRLYRRVIWTLDLFAALDARQQAASGATELPASEGR